MKMIAHRPFRDERRLTDFDPACLAGFEGVELDLRHLADGSIAVFHAPIFTLARKPFEGAAKPLEVVIERLAEAGAPTRRVFLDVKTTAAARATRRTLELLGPEREAAFICWHLDEVALVREAAPEAVVFLAVAPLRRARAAGAPATDYFLFNRFPYVARGERFRQRVGQFNQHNVNLRWLDPKAIRDGLPDGIDGICFHKRLFDRTLALAARDAGIGTAVYGFPSPKDPAIARIGDAIDFAIVDPVLGPRRRGALGRAAQPGSAANAARR